MFELNHNPELGVAEQLLPGLQVVTAPNAGPMTFTGTRSYLLGESEVALIDPGPDDEQHYKALILALGGRRLSHIIVTHSHIDHSPLARRLSKTLNAPVYGFGASHTGRSAIMEALAKQGRLGGGEGIDSDFAPDIHVKDKSIITGKEWQLQAIHTPGHLSNHLCFSWNNNIFSGDHVMGWATTMVSPPDGDLTQFMISLRALQNRKENVYFPGHGAPLENALAMLEFQISHRNNREQQIIAALAEGTGDVATITAKIYSEIDQRLWPAASRNVLAHIIDLIQRQKVCPIGELRVNGQFRLV